MQSVGALLFEEDMNVWCPQRDSQRVMGGAGAVHEEVSGQLAWRADAAEEYYTKRVRRGYDGIYAA